MLKYNIICVLLLTTLILFAEKPAYLISEIPAPLKANAHTVYRNLKYDIEIKSENSATAKIVDVRSILNKNGEDNVIFRESYNPMNKLGSLRGWVYDENGKRIRSVSNDDAYDLSSMGYSLYDENRVRILDPKCMTFPLTVKYECEFNLKQTLFLPSINLNDYNTSYENIEFTITTPKNFGLKYREYNLPSGCVKTTVNDKEIYSWKLTNIPAKVHEPFSSHLLPNAPVIRVVPANFMVDDSKGSTASWKEFGKWANSLLVGKDQLPEATVTKIKDLTSNLKTDFEKVKAVYEFMQKKTRYVSIQIGIGGWQPFGADVVDRTSYGDCKALSNYTKALLSAAGVKSHYVLVQAGSAAGSIDTALVGSQFNHAIVCVPLNNDTIWLETTDQLLPCGYNSDFTDDRLVLLLDGENSKIVRTRVYSERENCINRRATVRLSADKTGQADVETNYIGLAYDDMRGIYVADDNLKKQKITEQISIPGFLLKNFTLEEVRSRTPSFRENLSLDIYNCINNLKGSVDLLPLNQINKFKGIPDKVRNRKNQVCIRRSYMENDTITYILPQNYETAGLPEDINLSTDFGEYVASVRVKDKTVIYTRHFGVKKGIHTAEKYTDLREFLEKVSTFDEAMIELKKI